jgi:hypothetical protein
MTPKFPLILETTHGYKAEVTNPEEHLYHFQCLGAYSHISFDYYAEAHPKTRKAKSQQYDSTMAEEELLITFQATYSL